MKNILTLSILYDTPKNHTAIEMQNKLSEAIEKAYGKVFAECGVGIVQRTFMAEEVLEDIQEYLKQCDSEEG